jgi:hypothetical protein
MSNEVSLPRRRPEESADQKFISQPVYEPPKIVSYSSEEILEQVGPAQACSPSPCGVFG